MNTFSQVWVFSDTPSRLPELMNGAQALACLLYTSHIVLERDY